MTQTQKNVSKKPENGGKSDRDERLRKALKENLNKRKAQTRARKVEQDK